MSYFFFLSMKSGKKHADHVGKDEESLLKQAFCEYSISSVKDLDYLQKTHPTDCAFTVVDGHCSGNFYDKGVVSIRFFEALRQFGKLCDESQKSNRVMQHHIRVSLYICPNGLIIDNVINKDDIVKTTIEEVTSNPAMITRETMYDIVL